MIILPPALTAARDGLRARLPDLITALRAGAREHAPDVPAREAGYRISNAAGADGDTAVLRIYDEIWYFGINADDLVRDLDGITASKIRVEINSPGGDVWDGIAIYNALRHHSAHVTTRVDGMAASIASVIAQAGDHRVMTSASQMMIHNAWGIAIGDSQDHADMAALLDQQDDVIAGIYASRSGGDRDHFRDLMNAETWFTDQRAVDEGLADEVLDPARQEQPSDRTGRTLHDEISQAVSVVAAAVASAERVVALRADAGKDLSTRNAESLAGLRDAIGRLDNLLTTPPPADDTDDCVLAEYARFVAHLQGVSL